MSARTRFDRRGRAGPSAAVRAASQYVPPPPPPHHPPEASVSGSIDDMKADIQSKVKDHIKQYVIEHSSRGDSTTASYKEVWDGIASPDGMNADQVNHLLTDSGAWGSLTLTEKSVLGASSAKLADAVIADMNGGDGSGLITWDQFVKAAGLTPISADKPADKPKSKDALTWQERIIADAKAAHDAKAAKGGKFSGMHVADRFRSTASPQAVKIAPRSSQQEPDSGISSTTIEATAFGVPTAAGGLAAIWWGWRAFAIGGAVGVVAAVGVYAWSRLTARTA